MLKVKNKKNGFTLIEVIVSLVLLGIIGAIVGMGIANIAKGYVASSQNLDTAQKGTLVLSRLVKELSAVKTITAATATASSITFTRCSQDPINDPNCSSAKIVTNTIAVTVPNLLLTNSGTNTTDTLTNQVSTFTMTYYTCAAGAYNTCTAGAYNAGTTNMINIQLALIPQAGMTAVSFTDSIYIIRPYNI